MDREKKHTGRGHETRDIAVGKVAWAAVGLVLLMGLGALVAYLTFEYLVSIPREDGVAAPQRPSALPPRPRLQVQAAQDLNQMVEEAENRLNSYGWSDPANELVRIPIDRAMDLMAEQAGTGAPEAPAEESAEASETAAETPHEGGH